MDIYANVFVAALSGVFLTLVRRFIERKRFLAAVTLRKGNFTLTIAFRDANGFKPGGGDEDMDE